MPTPAFASSVAASLDDDMYLGPAEVVEVRGGVSFVSLPDADAPVRAQLAMALSYAPREGDTLLVIGRAEAVYAIGIVDAQGEVAFRFTGDVNVHAEDGELRVHGGEGIALEAPEVEVRAGTLQLVADTLVERARDLYTRVSDKWAVHAGSKTEMVSGEWSSRAEKAALHASDAVSVNGREIHLG